MKVFISWHGEHSRQVAREVRSFLESVLQGPKYFVSDSDIKRGDLWNKEVRSALDEACAAIVIQTPSGLNGDWLLFETGVVQGHGGATKVIPLLVNLSPADLTAPLADYQASEMNAAGVLRVVESLHELWESDSKADIVAVRRAVESQLNSLLGSIAEIEGVTQQPGRGIESKVDEVVIRVREVAQALAFMKEPMPRSVVVPGADPVEVLVDRAWIIAQWADNDDLAMAVQDYDSSRLRLAAEVAERARLHFRHLEWDLPAIRRDRPNPLFTGRPNTEKDRAFLDLLRQALAHDPPLSQPPPSEWRFPMPKGCSALQ